MKQNKRKEDTKRKAKARQVYLYSTLQTQGNSKGFTGAWKYIKKGNKELSLHKDTEEEVLFLSPFSIFHCTQTLPLLFLVVLVCLTLSCALTLPCFLFVCVCACHRVTWSVIRVSGTELSHIDRARPPLSSPASLSETQTESWLNWASDRARHWLTADTAFTLKGQTTTLHHIWYSL